MASAQATLTTTSNTVYRWRRQVTRALLYTLLLLGVFLSIFPLAWAILTSFKTFDEHINREATPDAWSPRPYVGMPSGGNYRLALLDPAGDWKGAPYTYSPLKEAIYTINGPEDLSPIIADKLDQESAKLLRRASDAQERAAALPKDRAEESERLQAEAAALENESHVYPLEVLILAADSSDDDVVNYDTFVFTVDARVRQQESTVLKKGEWGSPYYRYAPLMERWGPHFRVSQATQDSITVNKSWRVSRMLMFNYSEAWDEARFSQYFRNSLVISSTSVLGILAFSVLAAYAFARMQFPGREHIFTLYLATMMIPGIVLLLPNFMIVRELNVIFAQWLGIEGFWYDNLPPLVVPFLTNTFSIFLMRQFFLQVPQELYDAALIDGCGHTRFLTQVVLPLSKAPLMSVAVFNAIASWNSLLWPLLVTQTKWRPITVGLGGFIDEAGARVQLMMSGAVIASAPILVLYFLTQEQFTKGIATTGLDRIPKGER